MEITFRLATPLMLPNRMGIASNRAAHAHKRKDARRALALEVMSLVTPRPAQPLRYVTVQVWRHSIQEPDIDNLYGSLKHLLDVLQPHSKACPDGLGIIYNDKSAFTHVRAYHVHAARRVDQCTRVVIREMSQPMFAAMQVAA